MPLSSGTFRVDDLRPATGRGIRIVVVDSGVHASHPHVGSVAGGVSVSATGELGRDYVDRLGHGTAVTAAIREKAPEAEIWVARVFERRLDTTLDALVSAIDWAVAHRADLVNLSLGTANQLHVERLEAAVNVASAAGVWVVAAGEQDGARWLPGSLAGAVAVTLDWTLPRDACVLTRRADGHPRRTGIGLSTQPIPGVTPSSET